MFELIKDNVRVSLHTDCHEGYDGEYDPNDPTDKLLYRFDVDIKKDNVWEPVDDASYCTHLTVDDSDSIMNQAVKYIMDQVYDPCSNGYSIKKMCEMLSWISSNWFQEN